MREFLIFVAGFCFGCFTTGLITVFFLMGSIQRNCQHIIDTIRGNHDEA